MKELISLLILLMLIIAMCNYSYQYGYETALKTRVQESVPIPTMNERENIYEDTSESYFRQELLGTSDSLWCFLLPLKRERTCNTNRALRHQYIQRG